MAELGVMEEMVKEQEKEVLMLIILVQAVLLEQVLSSSIKNSRLRLLVYPPEARLEKAAIHKEEAVLVEAVQASATSRVKSR